MKSIHFYGASFALVAGVTGGFILLPGLLGEWLLVGSVLALALLIIIREDTQLVRRLVTHDQKGPQAMSILGVLGGGAVLGGLCAYFEAPTWAVALATSIGVVAGVRYTSYWLCRQQTQAQDAPRS